MPLHKAGFKSLLRSLDQESRSGQLAILAGAGISMVAPTGLPSGAELKELAVASIAALSPSLRKLLSKIQANSLYRTITPEILFQHFYTCLGKDKFNPFFQVLAHANVNHVHGFLAAFHTARRCEIMTTNFDNLIEKSCANPYFIKHLHGDLSHPESLVTRIYQVGRGLTKHYQDKVMKTLEGKSLCVLGYSGNDNDVCDAIVKSGVTKIYWLLRSSSDWAFQNIKRLAKSKDIFITVGDLGKLAKAFGSDVSAVPRPLPPSVIVKNRRDVIKSWSRMLTEEDGFACLSELFFAIEDYQMVAQISQQALRLSKSPSRAGWFHIQRANAYKITGDFGKATICARSAIHINSRRGDPFDLAAAYNVNGVIQMEKATPNNEKALKSFQTAYDILSGIDLRRCDRHRREKITAVRGRILNNMGLIYDELGEFENAIRTYKHCLRVKDRMGDLIGQARTLGNISIAYLRAAKRLESEQWRSQAFKLMEKYNLISNRAFVLRESGQLECGFGHIAAGKAMLKEALCIYESLGPQLKFDIELTTNFIAALGV